MSGRTVPGPLFVASPPNNSIRRLLIANRGEIACRIIATCRLLGIVSIALYTDVDKHSLYVNLADEAVCLGPIEQPSGNPHLNGQAIVDICHQYRADAIHPGYGYLSENADFAKLVVDSGIIFIGPSVYAISVLGDKRQAKDFLITNAPEVPLIPGYNGSIQDVASLSVEAKQIGFPIMIKAAAGGGGKGMRIVRNAESLEGELSRAQSEARRSFGSADCLLEKYIEHGKHVEVQVMGDSHGCILTLLDRECSIQRRHQKIVEEAPCSWMDDELRQSMFNTAITIAKHLRYEGAGTVEFMVDVEERKYYFLEVNTRIQVEHCISEEITRLDIVALQIYVATGGRLEDCEALSTIKPQGHAIECRLCAESPEADFMPSLGLIRRWTPAIETLPMHKTSNVRFENGIQSGASISKYFDSMIAKVVVWAPTRSSAIEKMLLILRNTVCIGVKTNHLFLQSCLSHPAFRERTDYTTNFVPANIRTLLLNPYVENVPELHKHLSVLPALFVRHIAGHVDQSTGSKGLFKSLRGFRNQTADQTNLPLDIVQTGSSGPVSLVTWPYEGNDATSSSNMFHANVQAVPKTSVEEEEKGPNGEQPGAAKIGSVIARKFSATISSTLANSGLQSGQAYQITLLNSTVKRISQSSVGGKQTSEWLVCDMEVEINGKPKMNLFLATDSALSISRVDVHVPFLGTSIEYRCFHRLSYGRSLRASFQALGSESIGAAERVYKAPMPCRVLSVTMKSGDEVKVGSTLCIIESMKTEIKIFSSVAGKFVAKVEPGVTVDIGAVLCTVD